MNRIILSTTIIGGLYNIKNGHYKSMEMINQNFNFNLKNKKLLCGEYFGAYYLYSGNIIGSFIFGSIYGLCYIPSLIIDDINNNNEKIQFINKMNIYL